MKPPSGPKKQTQFKANLRKAKMNKKSKKLEISWIVIILIRILTIRVKTT